jgi:effector-binding domain-containing protein
MGYDVVTLTLPAQPIAAVRRRVLVGDFGRVWKPALDQVWDFLRRRRGLRTDGHNCFLYRHAARPDEPMDAYFGVQVVRPFDGEGEVVCAETPAGEVVTATHVGSYDGLSGAHGAIKAWRDASGRAFGGCSWEIYGDWSDDPAKLETRVVYLLG